MKVGSRTILLLTFLVTPTAACSFSRDNPFDPDAPAGRRAEAVISGLVLLEAGGAQGLVTVAAESAQAGEVQPVAQTVAASDGTFTLSLSDGIYNLVVSATGYNSAFFNGIRLLPGEQISLGRVFLAVARGFVEGQVQLDAAGGAQPARAAQVVVTRLDVAGFAQSVLTDGGGRFRVDGVPQGSYEVRASLPDYAPSYTPAPVDVQGNEVTQVDPLTLFPIAAVVEIDGGVAYTRVRGVEVRLLRIVEALDEMRVSLDPTFTDTSLGDATFRAFSLSTPFQLRDQDGAQTVYVQFRESSRAGTETDLFSSSIVLDRGAPFVGAVTLNGAANFVSASVAQLHAEGSDALSGIRGYRVAVDGVLDGEPELSALYVSGAATLDVVLPLGGPDGVYSVAFAWIDRAGNESSPVVATITKDTAAPQLVTFAVIPAPLSNSEAVVLDVAATEALQMRLSNSADFAGADWKAYEPLVAWTLPPGDGLKTVHLQLRDAALNTTTATTAQVTLDKTPPTSVSLSINGDATVTSTPTVTLDIAASDAHALSIVLSNNSAFTLGEGGAPPVSEPMPGAGTRTWQLDGATDGLKGVWLRVIDAAGNVTTSTAFIELDTTTPQGTVTVQGGTHTSNQNVTLLLTATSADIVRLRGDIAPSDPNYNIDMLFQPSIGVALSTSGCSVPADNCLRTVIVDFKDTAGNSSTATAQVTYDITAPAAPTVGLSGTVATDPSIAGCAANPSLITRSQSVSVAVSSAETVDVDMQVSNDSSFAGAVWIPFAASVPHTLSFGDATSKAVYVRVRDATGNISTSGSAAIQLDTTAPTSPSVVIATGASGTNDTSPSVAFNVNPGSNPLVAMQMLVTADGVFDTEQWECFVASRDVPLAALDGPQNVTVLFRDAAGNVSATVASDGITVDLTDPTATIAPPPKTPDPAPAQPTVLHAGRELVVVFSETVNPGSLVLGGALGAAAVTTWSQTTFVNDTLHLLPATQWSGGSDRTLTVDVQDMVTNPVATLSVTYDVDATPPALVGTTPLAGAKILPSDDLVIAFDSPMNPASLVLSGTMASQAAASWNSPTDDTLTLTPFPGWFEFPGSETLNVAVTDKPGNALAPLALTYDVDGTPPVVATSVPANNGRLKSITNIQVTFSEPVQPGTLVIDGGVANAIGQPFNKTWASGNTQVTLWAPLTGWNLGSGRVLSMAVTDVIGNTAAALVLTLSVDDTPPLLTGQTPVDGSLIAGQTTLVVQFDEDVDPASISVTSSTLGAPASTSVQNGNQVVLTAPAGWWTDGAAGSLDLRVSDLAGNESGWFTLTYDVDAIPPALSNQAPANGSSIGAAQTLVLTYGEAVDIASLNITLGSLGTPSSQVWSGGDTVLTISPPGGGWSQGDARGMTVAVADFIGNVRTSVLSYDVLGAEVYVHPDGDSAGSGSAAAPLDDVGAAVVLAASINPPATQVRVAGRSGFAYLVDSSSSTHVVLAPNVDLLGGYSDATWAARDPVAFPTKIQDTSTAAASLAAPNRVIECGVGVTAGTLVDGFDLQGAPGSNSAALVCLQGTGLTLSNSRLSGGKGSGVPMVVLSSVDLLAYNNVLQAAVASASAGYAFRLLGGYPVLRHNTVWMEINASGNDVAAVFYQGITGMILENNVFYLENNGDQIAILEGADTPISAPNTVVVRNNNLRPVDDDLLFARYSAGATACAEAPDHLCYTTVATMEAAMNTLANWVASGNVSIGTEDMFVDRDGTDADERTLFDNNYRLRNDAGLVNLRRGALDGGPLAEAFGFDTDITGAARTNDATGATNSGAGGWSMGPYENDT